MVEWHREFHGIAVWYEAQAVHILLDQNLEAFLSRPGVGSVQLADHILTTHRGLFDAPLDISRYSLAIEVLGHVFMDNIASAAASLRAKIGPEKATLLGAFANSIKARTDIIDCGESAVDNNRFLWDTLVPFRSLIFRACGDRA